MQQTISGAFRTSATASAPLAGTAVNLQDGPVGTPAAATWTPGATLIDQLGPSPAQGQSWTIEAYSISLMGLLLSTSPTYGTLGKLIIAVMVNQTPTPANGNIAYAAEMIPLPADLATAATIWDGSQDSPFPQAAAGLPANTNVPILGGGNVPQPIAVGPGESIALGIWLTPSLIYNTSLAILNALYTVQYDDGRPTKSSAR